MDVDGCLLDGFLLKQIILLLAAGLSILYDVLIRGENTRMLFPTKS